MSIEFHESLHNICLGFHTLKNLLRHYTFINVIGMLYFKVILQSQFSWQNSCLEAEYLPQNLVDSSIIFTSAAEHIWSLTVSQSCWVWVEHICWVEAVHCCCCTVTHSRCSAVLHSSSTAVLQAATSSVLQARPATSRHCRVCSVLRMVSRKFCGTQYSGNCP